MATPKEFPINEAIEVIDALVNSKAAKAIKYISPRLIVRATAVKNSKGSILLSVTAPNHAERAFIKDCKKAKVAFPVANVQLKFAAKKKAAKKVVTK